MRIAVCDDNKAFLEDEIKLIGDAMSEIGVGCKIDAFTDPRELIVSGNKYDIIFFDVEMQTMTGIESAESVHSRHKNTLIFFVTNYEGYMDEALNKHAFRFWVKPLNRQRLMFGLESAVKEINNQNVSLQVTTGKTLSKIPINDIIYLYASNKNTAIVTVDGEIEIKEAFKNIVARLNPALFCASHASYCVNLAYVIRYNHEEVILRYKDRTYTAYMSKRKYPEFSAKFIKWAGEQL